MENTKWQRDIMHFCGVKSLFILERNISDLYIYEDSITKTANEYDLKSLLPVLFADGCGEKYTFLNCDPVHGFTDNNSKELVDSFRASLETSDSVRQSANAIANVRDVSQETDFILHISELIREGMTKRQKKEDTSLAFVFDYASRLTLASGRISDIENQIFINLLYGVQNAIRRNGAEINTLILIVNKSGDLPEWMYTDNPFGHIVTISVPDRIQREMFVKMWDDKHDPELDKFVDATNDMLLRDLDDIRRLREKRLFGAKSNNNISLLSVLFEYRYGIKTSPWEMIRARLGNKDNVIAKLSKRVIGQDEAIETIARILMRAVAGLSGIQHSENNNQPRGKALLAGPTGTGKTEIVKALAYLLFHDENQIIRFDMSEYQEQHDDQKLIGSPPGYVGHSDGGQLTNAVRERPFAILLFDELDKAHPSILKLFLQILEDGRITDGQGKTVYFKHTLIFFTTNAGIDWNTIKDDDTYEDIKEKVINNLKGKNTTSPPLLKPEVWNRFGESNVVVFNRISPSVADKIYEMKKSKIAESIQKRFNVAIDTSGIDLWLKERCRKTAKDMGGRGVGNVLEECFVNPVSDSIINYGIMECDPSEYKASTVLYGKKTDDDKIVFTMTKE